MFVVWNSLVWRININTLHQKVTDSSRRLSSIRLCHSAKKRILDLMEGSLWGIIFTMLQNAANWLKLRRIKTIAWLSQWTTDFAHFTADDCHLPSVIHLWPYFRVINTCSETVWSVEIKRAVSRCSPSTFYLFRHDDLVKRQSASASDGKCWRPMKILRYLIQVSKTLAVYVHAGKPPRGMWHL